MRGAATLAIALAIATPIAAAGSAAGAPLGDYTLDGACNQRGERAQVSLTADTFRYGETECRLLGPWTTLHEPTGTLSILVSGCGATEYTPLYAQLRTTPLSTGAVMFSLARPLSLSRPQAVFSATFCRHLPPLPRAQP